MARTDLTVTNSPGKTASPQGAQTAGIALTLAGAALATVGNQCPSTGKELIVAYNTATAAMTVTISSVASAESLGRTGDITAEAIAAGAVRIYGPFPTGGWRQTDGKLYMAASATTVQFGVVVLP